MIRIFIPHNPQENTKSLKTIPIIPEGCIKAAAHIEKEKKRTASLRISQKRNPHSSTPHSETHQSDNSFPLSRGSIWKNSLNPLLQKLSSTTQS